MGNVNWNWKTNKWEKGFQSDNCKLAEKYGKYASMQFFRKLEHSRNVKNIFEEISIEFDKAIEEFLKETEGLIRTTECDNITASVRKYISQGCYPSSTKRVNTVTSTVSGKLRWVWFLNPLTFNENEKIKIEEARKLHKRRGYRKTFSNFKDKTEICSMLEFIKNARPTVKIDIQNETVDGHKLRYYKNKELAKRIMIEDINIDLNDYINYIKNENKGKIGNGRNVEKIKGLMMVDEE